jgi:DNA polymerase I-like protein with 3'-5' exonuclease and polymerase domains
MNIHDELSWERHKTETEVFFEFQRIMQDWPDTQVPIVAEMDVTTTTWADKKGVHNLEELRLCLGD